ncbi:unnamed protein product [Parnassius apollo]|uniref:(apollo) hypothetical protein n=1 Tax=Parnassius apollo TaxID=110799 RepID=A0A8S3X8H3_PARAO|nr:unnamed protein product [Parnassius apollo]
MFSRGNEFCVTTWQLKDNVYVDTNITGNSATETGNPDYVPYRAIDGATLTMRCRHVGAVTIHPPLSN